MARPKSEDKRNAILKAATCVFAERGLAAAPTSAISKLAGVAEGTLFTYFKTKDDLVNSLYREIKLSLADAMLGGFPVNGSIQDKLRHIWAGYVHWGVVNPEQRKALAQLEISDALTVESREAGSVPFIEIEIMVSEALQQHVLRDDLPLDFFSTTMRALAEAAMELITTNPTLADIYRTSAFEMFWAGISRR